MKYAVVQPLEEVCAYLASLPRRLIEARLPLVVLAREGWVSGQSVAVVVRADEAGDRALAAAAGVARQSRSPVTLFVTETSGQARDEIVRRTRERLLATGVTRVDVIAVAAEEASSLAHAARLCRARLLVLPAPAEPDEAGTIAELLRRFSGALMLGR